MAGEMQVGVTGVAAAVDRILPSLVAALGSIPGIPIFFRGHFDVALVNRHLYLEQ